MLIITIIVNVHCKNSLTVQALSPSDCEFSFTFSDILYHLLNLYYLESAVKYVDYTMSDLRFLKSGAIGGFLVEGFDGAGPEIYKKVFKTG